MRDTAAHRIRAELAGKDPGNERYQADLAVALAHVGQVADAAVIADRLSVQPDIDNERRIDLARGYSQCARVTPADQTGAQSRFRGKAAQLLRDAVADGYTDRVHLATDPDLAQPQVVAQRDTCLQHEVQRRAVQCARSVTVADAAAEPETGQRAAADDSYQPRDGPYLRTRIFLTADSPPASSFAK